MGRPATTDASSCPPAELDRRLYAFTLDRLVVWSLDALAVVVAHHLLIGRDHVVTGVAAAVVAVLLVGLGLALLLGLRGISPGKAALGLRLVHHETGAPVGVGPALVRSLVLGVSALPTAGLGAATLAWTAVTDRGRRRRGWHDHLAGSIVVDVRPVPVGREEVAAAPRQVVNLTALRLVPAPAAQPAAGLPAHPLAPARPAEERATERAATHGSAPGRRAGPRWRVSFDSGETLVVEGLTLVGRRPEALPDEQVRHLVRLRSGDLSLSKTHAQLQVARDGALVVMDRGSTNGSILVRRGVGRELAPFRPVTLLAGDRVRLGDREMSVTRES